MEAYLSMLDRYIEHNSHFQKMIMKWLHDRRKEKEEKLVRFVVDRSRQDLGPSAVRLTAP